MSIPTLPTADEFIGYVTGDVVPAAHFDAVEEVLGSAGRLDLTLLNATTVRALAGTAEGEKVGLGVAGALRFNTANADASMPGGAEAGRYTIYVTTGATAITGGVDSTDYAWALAIVKQGGAAPSTAHKRIVGYLDWTGTAITRLVQTFMRRDDAPHAAFSSVVPPLEAIMPSAGTVNPLQVTVAGVRVLAVEPTGGLVSSAGLTAAQATLGRNDRLALALTGAAAGMTLGGDTQLYRAAASVLGTPGSITAGGYLQAAGNVYVGGNLIYGSGAGDTFLERQAANVLRTPGALQVGGNVLLTNNTGALVLGAAGDTNLYRALANVLKTDDALEVAGFLNVFGTMAHKGAALGFFNAAPIAQNPGWNAAISGLNAFTTLNQTITWLRELISALKQYGLLGA